MRHTILDIPIDALTRTEALMRVAQFLDEPRGHIVTTPNPEMLVDAQSNTSFQKVLQRADLALPDGVGLIFAGYLNGAKFPERIAGADMLIDVCELAARNGASVFLLGEYEDAISKKAAEALQEKFPRLEVVGAMSGGKITRDEKGIPRLAQEEFEKIRDAEPTILFVGFGHGVQEEWIGEHLKELPSVRVAMGIGGSFLFASGEVKRAPEKMRRLGLEWLWRLISQPWRAKRIFKAVFVFPRMVVKERINKWKSKRHI